MAASNDLDKLIETAINNRTFQVSWQGKRLTVEEARKQSDALKKEEQKSSSTAKRESFQVSAALARAKTRLTDATRNFDGLKGNKSATTAQLTAANNAVRAAQAEVDRLSGTTTTTTPTAASTRAGGRVTEQGATSVTPATVVSTPPQTSPTPTETPPESTETAPPRTPRTRKDKKTKVLDDSFLDELAARFPAYADWTSEQAIGYFGDDLIQVLRDINSGVLDSSTDAGRQAIERRFSSTNYWLTVDDAVKKWDAYSDTQRARLIVEQKRALAQSFGDLQLDDAALTDLATTIQRTGQNELGAKQLVYGRAFQSPISGVINTRRTALDGADADEIRKIAKAYGYNPVDLDNQIEAILTGKTYSPTGTVLSQEGFRQKAQRYAKGQYSWLSDQFDAGLTLNDIMGNYTEIASRVLEIDPNAIDYVGDPKWQEALGTRDGGQLALNEWVRKLKSDPQYGYQYTNQANSEVTKIVSDLEKAFGFRK
jgi:hypothetical protein